MQNKHIRYRYEIRVDTVMLWNGPNSTNDEYDLSSEGAKEMCIQIAEQTKNGTRLKQNIHRYILLNLKCRIKLLRKQDQ